MSNSLVAMIRVDDPTRLMNVLHSARMLMLKTKVFYTITVTPDERGNTVSVPIEQVDAFKQALKDSEPVSASAGLRTAPPLT